MINQSLEESAKECEVKFKVALVEKQITQRKLAAKLGTTPQQVNRAIKGDTSPMSKKIREKMQKILGITD
ncbi:helix-turn-helix transcriptional regulator [Lactobacillus sp. IBH004]|uniref:helix-turn-helix domain-containing protein n=1 Tax=Lactobacillus sp. IBH004 TaxID=2879107 RepID=UPI00224308B5|nr:helix-turn-helix transcriptional regulator [Lactobacillus sp. IBH004]UZN41874.1 helix-turn-helix transcriptional regulator [Lactobacillus sp. IBH004]